MENAQFTKETTNIGAAYLGDEITICDLNHSNILPTDVPIINEVLRARSSSDRLALIVKNPTFVGNCSQTFFKGLLKTLNQKANIQVRGCLNFKALTNNTEKCYNVKKKLKIYYLTVDCVFSGF